LSKWYETCYGSKHFLGLQQKKNLSEICFYVKNSETSCLWGPWRPRIVNIQNSSSKTETTQIKWQTSNEAKIIHNAHIHRNTFFSPFTVTKFFCFVIIVNL